MIAQTGSKPGAATRMLVANALAARPAGPLTGRVALVTGASRGIGAAAARALAGAGAAAVLLGRDEAALAVVVADIRRNGGTAMELRADVGHYTEVAAAVATAHRLYGRLDILINSAGIIDPLARLEDCDPDAWSRTIRTNLIGPLNACHAAFPLLLSRPGGVVINLSSGAAVTPRNGMSAYGCSKAGLAMLTRSLHLECAGAGLRVFGLRPGMVATGMQDRIRAASVNSLSRVDPVTMTDPDTVARAILWLSIRSPDDLIGTEVFLGDPAVSSRIEEASLGWLPVGD